MSELARRVRERRAALGLSQEELADRMGYRSKSSITKLEKGVNDLPQSKLEELAAALDTTPAWLLGIETAAAPPPGFEPLPEMVRAAAWLPPSAMVTSSASAASRRWSRERSPRSASGTKPP